MQKYCIAPVEKLPKFCGGAVGYLSYEAVTRFEELPSPEKDRFEVPESLFMMVDTLLVFDHVTHKIKVMSHVSLDGDVEESYRAATEKIDNLISRLNGPVTPTRHLNGSVIPAAETRPSSNFTREEYKAVVEKIREYIVAGEVIQVVPSQRLSQPTTAAPFDIYRALRTINPSPYMFYFDFKDFHIIGASPEILVRVEGGTVTTRPLAGTRPRGKTPAEDIALEKELKADEKERAEPIMLVDLGRNDIGRVSEGLFPGRDCFRRAENPGDGDNRRGRAGKTGTLRRGCRILLLHRGHGHGYLDSDDGVEGRDCLHPGGRGDSLRQRTGYGVRGDNE
jgi:anthranilate synthase component 1